jgi:hypothetical protein
MKVGKFWVLAVMLFVSLFLFPLMATIGGNKGKKVDTINALTYDALTDSARDDDPFAALMKARTIKCFLGKGCTADWATGDPNLTIGEWRKSREESIMIFDSIDLKKGTARLIGGLGSTDVTVIASTGGITFIEKTPLGNLTFTTVFPSYKRGTKDHIFVHSRHMSTLKEPLPSQWHGACKTFE